MLIKARRNTERSRVNNTALRPLFTAAREEVGTLSVAILVYQNGGGNWNLWHQNTVHKEGGGGGLLIVLFNQSCCERNLLEFALRHDCALLKAKSYL